MRGARERRNQQNLLIGIIPADAGSTALNLHKTYIIKDHPRGCGEHLQLGKLGTPAVQSSPRMRGALAAGTGRGYRPRIIPADAGSTDRPYARQTFRRDHPRGCGEHTIFNPIQSLQYGSSPRMRGARLPPHLDALDGGIIPADAGSTGKPRQKALMNRDHPRGCGEHEVYCHMAA